MAPERGAPYRTAAGTVGQVRSYRPHDRVRVTGPHERDEQRAHWRAVLDAIENALAEAS